MNTTTRRQRSFQQVRVAGCLRWYAQS